MLGLPSVEATDEMRILLIELSGYVQGMLVDGVAEIVNFKASDIEMEAVGGDGNPAIGGRFHSKNLFFQLSQSVTAIRSRSNALKLL